jgi:hypothetical protein
VAITARDNGGVSDTAERRTRGGDKERYRDTIVRRTWLKHVMAKEKRGGKREKSERTRCDAP